MNNQKVKEFYSLNANIGIATCNLCKKSMNGMHVGNLKKHLQNVHREVSLHKTHL